MLSLKKQLHGEYECEKYFQQTLIKLNFNVDVDVDVDVGVDEDIQSKWSSNR